MSIHDLNINERKDNIGLGYDAYAFMYRNAVLNRHYKQANEYVKIMESIDKELANQKEP